MTTAIPRTYPITPRPSSDSRFTFGLLLDVARVLENHGYTPLNGPDLVELRQTLFRLLYGDA